MMRRMLAFAVGLLLMANLFAITAAPLLVCRYTGEPMVPVAATPKTTSCCAVSISSGANSHEGYALSNPGCCDLRVSPDHRIPAAALSPSDLPVLVAWVPAPLVMPVPALTDAVVSLQSGNQTAPRGPPLRSGSPRAPPFS